MPVSVTAMEISPTGAWCSRRMPTEPSGVNFRAFESRLMTICLTFWRSVSITGRSGERSRVTARRVPGDHRLDLGHHLVDQLGEEDALDLDGHLAGLDAGDVQQVVDHRQQVAGVGVDARQLVRLGGVDGARDAFEHQVRVAHDGVERCAQLVGDVGEELRLEGRGLLQLQGLAAQQLVLARRARPSPSRTFSRSTSEWRLTCS